ncbi:leader peptidase (prepilin peptidase)/N-methyltransferase [Mycolicibacterium sp. BK634]|uniref:prepilin peptidase n=1 Tax=Mycobacterium sp. BK086 TaxID=2512165 RepID=UPI00105BDA03|nr:MULTISPECIES: A24 family peptidase [Mycobacteriaceae]MBB3752882.1 leader peptidase (prepilin peptidase)/N-methyltransferase [Mycolicibacterium sp. BK634]TDO17182.1 leader peptidase (prepilin peptidase)/N-methyltransferase [Mycobacterium sp. BK086]
MPVLFGIAVTWAAVLSVFDVRHRRLPNALTLPGAIAVLAVAGLNGRGLPALTGALGLAALYLVVHLAIPAGLGAGDVKLALGVGGLTGAFGPDVWLLAALGAPVLTGLVGIVVAVRDRSATVPHGPSMCLASLAAAALVVW